MSLSIQSFHFVCVSVCLSNGPLVRMSIWLSDLPVRLFVCLCVYIIIFLYLYIRECALNKW
jgi:hypothetical protein